MLWPCKDGWRQSEDYFDWWNHSDQVCFWFSSSVLTINFLRMDWVEVLEDDHLDEIELVNPVSNKRSTVDDEPGTSKKYKLSF